MSKASVDDVASDSLKRFREIYGMDTADGLTWCRPKERQPSQQIASPR
jgi:hypothetical protein